MTEVLYNHNNNILFPNLRIDSVQRIKPPLKREDTKGYIKEKETFLVIYLSNLIVTVCSIQSMSVYYIVVVCLNFVAHKYAQSLVSPES